MDAATFNPRGRNDDALEKLCFRAGLKSRDWRDWKVESGRSKDREREGKESFDEERRGEREEKKGLKEKREERRGGNEIKVFTAAKRVMMYGSWSWR